MHIAAATALALVHRNRTGRGQFVDVGVMEAVATAVAANSIPQIVYGEMEPPVRSGRLFARGPWGVFATRDGEFAALTAIDRHWHAFLKLMGNPDWGNDPRWAQISGMYLRAALTQDDRDELAGHIGSWFREHTTAEVWEMMCRERVSFHPVHSVPQVVESAHMEARGYFVPAPGPHPPLTVPGAPYPDVDDPVAAARAATGARRPAGDRVDVRAGDPP